MPIVRSSRLYICHYRLWCTMPWLLVVGGQVQGSRLCVRDEGCCSTAVEQHPNMIDTVWRVSVSVTLWIQWSLLWHRHSLESVCVGGTVHSVELVAPAQFGECLCRKALCIQWSLLWHRHSLESVCVSRHSAYSGACGTGAVCSVSVSVGTKCFLNSNIYFSQTQ